MSNIVFLTSMQPAKVSAIRNVFPKQWKVQSVRCDSGIPEQPYGRRQIRTGAMHRLNIVSTCPVISLETGIVRCGQEYVDITCCLLRTRFGTFEAWSDPVKIPGKYMDKWFAIDNDVVEDESGELKEERFNTTVGSIIHEDLKAKYKTFNPNDWYQKVNSYLGWGHAKSYTHPTRVQVMTKAVSEVCRQWRVAQESLPAPVLPATLSEFKGVSFLDIQHPLIHHSRDMSNAVRRLADRLLFDTVMVMDARGFLLCGEFMHEDYPVVMARKPGKLPNEELKVEYTKEYGTDTLCISKGAITPGARVIVLDDLIATGGTMMAADELVKKAGGEVVAFLAPYAIEVNGQLLGKTLGARMRYVCTQNEAKSGQTHDLNFEHRRHDANVLAIAPPSLRSLTITAQNVPMSWGRFHRASNIWFDPSSIEDRKVYVFLDPSNHREMIDVLQVLSILYRKDPKKIVVVIPFLEQATQDRIEFNGTMESVAAVDTLSKLVGKHTILTFDLHAEQSQFAFYDLRFKSLVAKLWHDFHLENPNAIPVFPDAGAAKRFGNLPGIVDPVVFRKKRRGEKRFVHTDDDILAGSNYVVIDDLVRSGGTMRAVGEYLKTNQANLVSALFAHAPLEPKACANMSNFDEVWTSDSCPRLVPSAWVRVNVIDML
jgi:adenine phosphoribosyltransferase